MVTSIFLSLFFAGLAQAYLQNGVTLNIVDNTSPALSSSTIQNQVNLFYAYFPGASGNYNSPPTTVTLTIDPTLASNSVSASTSGIKLASSHLQSSPNDASYINFAIDFMLNSFYTKKAGATTTAAPTTTTAGTGSNAMTDALRQQVLNLHNSLRSTVAKGQAVNCDNSNLPSASNMYKLSYSKMVESYAQQTANTCNWAHTSVNSTSNNLYLAGTQGSWVPMSQLMNDAPNDWYSELKNDCQNGLVMDGSNYNHFTQVVWAGTKQIGCAVAYCPTMTGGFGPPWQNNFVVCDYWLAGNMGGASIYSTGSTASACPSGSTAQSTGLCQINGVSDIHA